MSKQDKSGNGVRNHIDYILITKIFHNGYLSVKTYPGAGVPLDHIPLVGKFKVSLNKIKRMNKNNRWDMRRFKTKKRKGR